MPDEPDTTNPTTTSPATPTRRPSARDQRFVQRYGPWAVVTGASSGIGQALARGLAARGLNVVLVARSTDALQALARELHDTQQVSALALPLDLADRDSNAQLEAATSDLDVGLLVAAAGFGTSGTFAEATIDDELDMIDLNCAALCAHTHQFARRFVQRGRGGIILLSSIVAFQGLPHAANYAATKAYVQVLGEGLAVELGPRGVDVLTVAPGPTRSGFGDRAGMHMKGADSSEQLVAPILGALGRRATVLPSPRSKLLRSAVVTMPARRGRIRIMGNIMKGMTSHP